MKKFLLNALAAFTGSCLTMCIGLLLFFILLGAMIAGLVGGSDDAPYIDDASVLTLTLGGVMDERLSDRPVDVQEIISGTERGTTLQDMLAAIRGAKGDRRIRGIELDCQGLGAMPASLQEIIEALADFRRSGKWIIAYGDAISQGDYYVACGADEVYLNPQGRLSLQGLGGSVMFFKGLLDKLGVKMQVFKVGTFKSAVEPFLLTEMSGPSRMQTRAYLDGIWAEYTARMARERGVTVAQINQWADSLLIDVQPARLASRRLVTAAIYRREVDDKIRQRLRLDKDTEICRVTPEDYLALNPDAARERPSRPHIAVLYAVGDIVDSGNGGIAGDVYTQQILDLAKDDNVRGMVLRVNSGGGSAFASEQIWDALQQFKKAGKPLYVSMGDMAASGGYYISCGADSIYADPATLTGSIGIFGMMPDLQGLVSGHLGIGVSTVGTNANSAFPDVFAPMTERERDVMQRNVEQGYDTFVSRVAAGRGLTDARVREIAEGRVWYGREALRIGLVDHLGSLHAALGAMARKTGLAVSDIATYPPVELNPLRQLLEQAVSGQAFAERLRASGLDADQAAAAADALLRFTSMAPLQARCPRITIR